MKRFVTTLIFCCALTAALAGAQVELQYVKDVSFVLAHARVIHQLEGQVVVENLAYEKQVTIVYTLDGGGSWQETQACFAKSLGGNKDLFIFAIGMGESDYNNGNYFSRQTRFAVKYQVAGQTFWDNNGGSDYSVGTKGYDRKHPRILLGCANVRLMGMQSRPVYPGSDNWCFEGWVAVKNLGYHKKINIVYSLDNWATVKVAATAYNGTHGNAEVWIYSVSDVRLPGQRYSFAVSYEVNGQTYWDNWNGDNYFLEFDSWNGMDLWH